MEDVEETDDEEQQQQPRNKRKRGDNTKVGVQYGIATAS